MKLNVQSKGKIKILSIAGMLLLFLALTAGCKPVPLPDPTTSASPAPSGLQVQLAWNSNPGEQQGFLIEESTDGNTFTQVLTVPDGNNTAAVPVSSPGSYFFRVRSYNQSGDSPYTAIVSANVSGP